MSVSKSIWQSKATKLGEILAKEQKIVSLPVSPFDIADNLEIQIEPLPPEKKGVSGMLLYSNNNFGIMYASYLDNPGFENFCVGHEIGHYSIAGHPENILIKGQHISTAGFSSTNRYELEADHFSAGLLMPSYLFDEHLNQLEIGMKAISSLSKKCQTSLTATAIRYAQRSPDAVAIILSEGDVIKYCFMSEEMREIKGLNWIKKNSPVPPNTVTYEFNKNQKNILDGNEVEGQTTLLDWFGSNLQFEIYEEIVGLGAYGKTLTVLSIEEFPDQEEIDEEDELIESWTPRFKR